MENFIPVFSVQQLKQKRQNGCRSRKKFQSNLMKKKLKMSLLKLNVTFKIPFFIFLTNFIGIVIVKIQSVEVTKVIAEVVLDQEQ